MKIFLKKFPLTVYAVMVLLFIYFTDENIQYDSNFIHVALLMILSLPLIAIGQIYTFLKINVSLPWVIPLFLLLDLLLLSLRTGSLKNFLKKTYHKFTKPKK